MTRTLLRGGHERTLHIILPECSKPYRSSRIGLLKMRQPAIWEKKIQAAGGRCVSDGRGFVVLLFATRGSRELSEMYQDFGLLCAQGKVRWALFRTGEEDGDAHYALRDVLRTVALIVGVPLQLKLALVATSQSVAQACRAMQEELRVLGCDARVFRIERQAEQWLRAAQQTALPRVRETALS